MKRKFLLSLVAAIFLAFSFSEAPVKIYHLHMGYAEVMRCNGQFAKSDDDYWNKDWFFGRDSVNKCGMIQFDRTKKTCIPLVKPMSAKRKRGEAWTEQYANDSITITLHGEPGGQKIQRMHSYHVTFELVHRNDTLRENLVGHCRY
jgi:hypothetical protein